MIKINNKMFLVFLILLFFVFFVYSYRNTINYFDDQDNPFNVMIDYNYETILKNENISYYNNPTCGYVSHGCKWWNYTLNTAATQSGLIELETNFSLAADCIQNPLQIMVGQTIVGVGPTTTQYLYCVNSTDGLVSLGSKQTSSQSFVIYLNTLYKREYLTIPIYAYVENITLNITGGVDNPYLSITGKTQWFYNNTFSVSQQPSINISLINNILEDGCTCEGCVISGTDCKIPFDFYSDTTGLIEVELLNASYAYGIDNCSNSFDIPSNRTFYYLTKDQKSNSLIITNGTFDFFYGNSLSYTINEYNNNNYTFCVYPSRFNLNSDMTHIFTKPGYENLDFYKFNQYLNGSFLVYLLKTESSSAYITYIITDQNLGRIENASFKVYRTIDGVKVLIYEDRSDVNGQIVVYQDQLYKYSYVLNHSDYPVKEFELKPVSTLYTLKLTETSSSVFVNRYQGLRYKITPEFFLFENNNGFKNITLEIEGSDLEYYGINVTNFAGNCNPTNCKNIGTNQYGGNVTVGINYTGSDSFRISIFFKRDGFDNVYIKGDGAKITHFETTKNSLYELFKSIYNNTTDVQRVMIFTIINIVIFGVLYELGIIGFFGLPLLIVSNLVFSFAGCGAIGRGLEGGLLTSRGCEFYFVHPSIGIFTTIVALLGYLAISARREG